MLHERIHYVKIDKLQGRTRLQLEHDLAYMACMIQDALGQFVPPKDGFSTGNALNQLLKGLDKAGLDDLIPEYYKEDNRRKI